MASSKNKSTLATGMLAFERSMQITEAFCWGAKAVGDFPAYEDKTPIFVVEQGARGQNSQYGADKRKKGEKGYAAQSSLQTVDKAIVPADCDTLLLSFSVRILPSSKAPCSSNDPAVWGEFKKVTQAFADVGGYDALAELYLWNIANGRFAWRNRYNTDQACIRVTFQGNTIEFDPFAFDDLDEFEGWSSIVAAMTVGDENLLKSLRDLISKGLTTERAAISVTWISEALPGQEVFPSQEYVREAKSKDANSRVLATLPTWWKGRLMHQASMHSQKIGAAIRHIDIWHGSENYGAIAVNPFGGVQETGDVLRLNKNNFYNILKDPKIRQGIENGEPSDEAYFLVANLVRGGVFGVNE